MTEGDATGPHAAYLARQLAVLYSDMRGRVPRVQLMGNLTLCHSFESSSIGQVIDLFTIATGGQLTAQPTYFLNHDIQPSHPIATTAEYYSYLIADELYKLRTRAVFASIRPRLTPILEDFTTNILPCLPCLTTNQQQHGPNQNITFTHHDFSPRNILLLDSQTDTVPPSISGLIDFEFAGFFPDNQELLNAHLQQDWPDQFLDLFARNLDPTRTGDNVQQNPSFWEQAILLTRLVDNIAHWRFHALEAVELTADQYEALNRHVEIVVDLVTQLTEQTRIQITRETWSLLVIVTFVEFSVVAVRCSSRPTSSSPKKFSLLGLSNFTSST